jgi:DNA-binding MarR family transcriptional regulator
MSNKRGEQVATEPQPVAKPRRAKSTPAAVPQPAEPPLLELDWSFGYLFKQAHRTFTRPLAARLREHGITLAQWYFLRELWQEEGITQRELSRRMDISEPTTTVALDLMEKAGLIKRKRDPMQRNAIKVRLTPKGRLLKQHVAHIALDVNIEATKGIDEADLEVVRRAVLQMMDNINRSSSAAATKGALGY